MNIITAIENKKINEQLKKIKNINILNSDIQYKDGILEYLEKDINVDIILIKENLPGQIKENKLIENIWKINKKIKIIIIINNKNKINSENKILNKNLSYIYLEKINLNNIKEILNINYNFNEENKKINSSKMIQISGTSGVGKTIFVYIFTEILSKNNKILLIDENKNKSLSKIYLKDKKENNSEIIKIKNKIYLLNLNYLINKKIDIINYLKNINKNYNYIFIDFNDLENDYKKYYKIINKNIYLITPNLLELIKINKNIIKNEKTEIILNKININSIDDEIIKNTINKKILKKINYNKNINLFINNNFNLEYLNKKEKNNFIEIINKI